MSVFRVILWGKTGKWAILSILSNLSGGKTIYINAEKHPGLHRYSLDLLQYPKLTKEQYASVIADLKRPEETASYQDAREKMICSHLGMVLGLGVLTLYNYYGLSLEDYVGIGNQALLERFDRFDPDRGVPFSSYMRKVIIRYEYAVLKEHLVWDRAEDVDVELVGTNDAFFDRPDYDYLYRAIGDLSELEQEIIHYSFFDDFAPEDREIARKLRISKSCLVETKRKVLEKLRRSLKTRRPLPDRRYVIEPKEET